MCSAQLLEQGGDLVEADEHDRVQSSNFNGDGYDDGRHDPSFDFTVTSLAPGRAEIDADPDDTIAPTSVVVGDMVRVDGLLMRLESSDGQTATFAFPAL